MEEEHKHKLKYNTNQQKCRASPNEREIRKIIQMDTTWNNRLQNFTKIITIIPVYKGN
jgi:hypothetical protein